MTILVDEDHPNLGNSLECHKKVGQAIERDDKVVLPNQVSNL